MQKDILTVVLLLFLVSMSAYFSASETAFSSLNITRIKSLAEKGNKKADLVLKLSVQYDKLLSSILIGNNIVILQWRLSARCFLCAISAMWAQQFPRW